MLRHDSFIYIEVFDYNTGHLIILYIQFSAFLLSKSARNILEEIFVCFSQPESKWSLSQSSWKLPLVVCLPVCEHASPPLADLVTWFANFIQLTPSRRALWREEKRQLEKN